MQDFKDRTAFVTGGASGIGLALAKAFAAEGMRVMLADVEQGALDRAVAEMTAGGAQASGVRCDVADAGSVQSAARATVEAFGKVHVVCNNAGVGGGSALDPVPLDDWRWVVGVNLMGVVHGVAAFLPLIRQHGEGGHFLNTASMAGMFNSMGFNPYPTTKAAVVAMSEGLAMQLAEEGIGVSVLCPAFVRTRIHESYRNRPVGLAPVPEPQPDSPGAAMMAAIAAMVEGGKEPDEIAAASLAAIKEGRLYVFTHPEAAEVVEQRFDRIVKAMKGEA